MSSDLLAIFLLSLVALFNPSLMAAVTVMLLLPSPRRLMFGYLLGAYLTSITAGLVIVFSLNGSGVERTDKHTIGPVEDLAKGMTYAQREAFVALVTRRVMHAGEQDRREAQARTLAAARAETRQLTGRVTKLSADLAVARDAQSPEADQS